MTIPKTEEIQWVDANPKPLNLNEEGESYTGMLTSIENINNRGEIKRIAFFRDPDYGYTYVVLGAWLTSRLHSGLIGETVRITYEGSQTAQSGRSMKVYSLEVQV